MAYTKNTWATGDIVTSAKLNHMEDGIEGAYEVMVINITMNATKNTFDKTWQEIYDAMAQGKMCVARYVGETTEEGIANYAVTTAYSSEGEYLVSIGEEGTYIALSATGYPEFDNGGGDNA